MAWRYRRSKKLGPFRLTATQAGLSVSVGSKTSRLTKRADGKLQQTVRVPGIGLDQTRIVSSERPTPWLFTFPGMLLRLFVIVIIGVFKILLAPLSIFDSAGSTRKQRRRRY